MRNFESLKAEYMATMTENDRLKKFMDIQGMKVDSFVLERLELVKKNKEEDDKRKQAELEAEALRIRLEKEATIVIP